MTEPATTVLSVRGEAQRVVAPDSARIDARVTTIEASKAEALRATAAALDAVRAELAELGGTVLDSVDQRRDLGWIAYSAVTWEERNWQKNDNSPTGRIGAGVALQVSVRDFSLMDRVGDLLAEHPSAHIINVDWAVDYDNVAWSEVRAAAIGAALAKGRDYAAALGGTVQRVEHIADAGLLGGHGASNGRESQLQSAAIRGAGRQVEGDSPPLDAMPQTLSAVIEARLLASVAPLS